MPPLQQKGKFCPPNFLISVPAEDFRAAYCVAGGSFGRPWCVHDIWPAIIIVVLRCNDYIQYREVDSSEGSSDGAYSRRQCYVLLERCVDVTRQWTSAVPGFSDLNSQDQRVLYRSSLLEVVALRIADRSDQHSQRFRKIIAYDYSFVCVLHAIEII